VPRKHAAHHEEHENHEAWVIPYADLLTLLLAMFLALWASSTADSKKMRQLASAFQSQIGAGQVKPIDPAISGAQNASLISTGGLGILDLGGLQRRIDQLKGQVADDIIKKSGEAGKAKQAEVSQLAKTEADIAELVVKAGLVGKVKAVNTDRGLRITLSADELLFASGSADLIDASALDQLAPLLVASGQQIEIVGHTDSIPLSGGPYGSNLGLSGVRAGNVGQYLIEKLGIDPRLVTTAGNGDLFPIADNTTPEGRTLNRRVEITLLSKYPTTTATATPATGSAPASNGSQPTPTTPTTPNPDPATPTGNSSGASKGTSNG
jgi:chemotaxis protein MotB